MLARVFRLTLGLVVLVALPVATIGCGGLPTAPSNSAPFSQLDVRVGTGADVVTGSVLTVNYNGWFYDGSVADHKGLQFATSTGSGPAEFTVGAGALIEGWEKGVVGMKAGGLRRLVVPPSLAYGSQRFGAIPPNATLVFEIEVLTVQ